jgi:hypothetical protein
MGFSYRELDSWISEPNKEELGKYSRKKMKIIDE